MHNKKETAIDKETGKISKGNHMISEAAKHRESWYECSNVCLSVSFSSVPLYILTVYSPNPDRQPVIEDVVPTEEKQLPIHTCILQTLT